MSKFRRYQKVNKCGRKKAKERGKHKCKQITVSNLNDGTICSGRPILNFKYQHTVEAA